MSGRWVVRLGILEKHRFTLLKKPAHTHFCSNTVALNRTFIAWTGKYHFHSNLGMLFIVIGIMFAWLISALGGGVWVLILRVRSCVSIPPGLSQGGRLWTKRRGPDSEGKGEVYVKGIGFLRKTTIVIVNATKIDFYIFYWSERNALKTPLKYWDCANCLFAFFCSSRASGIAEEINKGWKI